MKTIKNGDMFKLSNTHYDTWLICDVCYNEGVMYNCICIYGNGNHRLLNEPIRLSELQNKLELYELETGNELIFVDRIDVEKSDLIDMFNLLRNAIVEGYDDIDTALDILNKYNLKTDAELFVEVY